MKASSARHILPVLLPLALLLGACGSGDDDNDAPVGNDGSVGTPAPGPAPAPGAAPAPGPTPAPEPAPAPGATPAPTPTPAPAPTPGAAPAPSPTEPIGTVENPRRLYIFGDSLSDTGNLGRPATFGFDLPDPFFMNRITNGKVIVDHVAEALNTTATASNYLSLTERGTNYAMSGAQALEPDALVDLSVQVDTYLRNNLFQADSGDAFLIFIGGNDIIEAVNRGDQGPALMRAAAAEVAKAVEDIADRGGTRFLILNVPDIGRTPKMLDASQSALATQLTQIFNQAVLDELAALSPAPANLDVVDVYAIFNDLLSRSAALGYTDTTRGCYVTDRLQFESFCNAAMLDSFVFFDSIHPSAKTHRLIGEQVIIKVRESLTR